MYGHSCCVLLLFWLGYQGLQVLAAVAMRWHSLQGWSGVRVMPLFNLFGVLSMLIAHAKGERRGTLAYAARQPVHAQAKLVQGELARIPGHGACTGQMDTEDEWQKPSGSLPEHKRMEGVSTG